MFCTKSKHLQTLGVYDTYYEYQMINTNICVCVCIYIYIYIYIYIWEKKVD